MRTFRFVSGSCFIPVNVGVERTRRHMRVDLLSKLNACAQGVLSRNRVVTIAGNERHGKHDDVGELATFNGPQSLFMAQDGNIYVADSTNCRIRRISHADHVAPDISCSTRTVEVCFTAARCKIYGRCGGGMSASRCCMFGHACDCIDFGGCKFVRSCAPRGVRRTTRPLTFLGTKPRPKRKIFSTTTTTKKTVDE